MKLYKPLLIVALVLVVLLRFWNLMGYPAGFTADEAAQGYTAYSILKTGKDEWGKTLPLSLRSFGDFKPPLYTYLAMPSVAVFGLNEFAVRLPAAICGILAIVFTYLFVRELFSTDKILSYRLSLVSCLLLAISPWHFSLSRGAFESNLTTMFVPAGAYFFLRGLKKPWLLPLSSFVFGLNLLSYHSPKLLTLLIVAFLVIWKKLDFLKNKKQAFASLLIFGVFIFIAFFGLMGDGSERVADIGIFSAGIEAPKIFFSSYLSYISMYFLFARGAGEATYGMFPGKGLLHVIDLFFLAYSIIYLIRNWKKEYLLIVFWILISPVPASLAAGVGYHANRVAIMMPAIQILVGLGLLKFIENIKHGRRAIVPALIALYSLSFIFFLYSYFKLLPKIAGPAMAFGWRDAWPVITQKSKDYDEVIVSRKLSEPQAMLAFYLAWSPQDIQKESQDWFRYKKEGLKFLDQLGEYHLGKYTFREIYWNEDRKKTHAMFVVKGDEIPLEKIPNKRIIPYPNGTPSILIVEN